VRVDVMHELRGGDAVAITSTDASNWNGLAYRELRTKLDFTPRSWPSLAIVAFDVALLSAAAWLLAHGGVPAFLLSQVLLAVVFFNSFGLLHECGHGSASSSPAVNALLGHWASTFCFIPYYPWKYIHQKHHAITGNLERDPVLKSLQAILHFVPPNHRAYAGALPACSRPVPFPAQH
jgi:fatty acid desaturase